MRRRDSGWGHEIKFDGYRMQMRVEDGRATLRTRSGLDWTDRFPEIAAVGAKLPDCIVDGEICALDRARHPELLRAAGRTRRGGDEATSCYFVFDLLFADGADLRDQAVAARKARLVETAEAEGDRATAPLCGAFRDGRGRPLEVGLPDVARGRRLQAARCAVPVGTRRQLAQDQVPGAATRS